MLRFSSGGLNPNPVFIQLYHVPRHKILEISELASGEQGPQEEGADLHQYRWPGLGVRWEAR